MVVYTDIYILLCYFLEVYAVRFSVKQKDQVVSRVKFISVLEKIIPDSLTLKYDREKRW